MEQHTAAGPLADIRVLELTDEKGQYCGKLMADMGADVIKVEPPGGDGARRVGPFVDDVPGPDRSLYFWHYNTSKRGVTLHLGTPQGRQIFTELARRADIVLESQQSGYLEGLGLGWSALSQINPRQIMTSITPFGQTGPWRDFLASDLVSLAAGGPMASSGYDHLPDSPPSRGLWDNAYQIGCHYAFVGTLVALFDRDRIGQGQYVDVSIHEACSGTTEGAFPQWEYFQKVVLRQTGRHAAATPTPPWQILCTDGIYINVFGGLPRSQESWRLLLQWMASEGMAEDLLDEKYADLGKFRQFGARSDETDHIIAVITRFVQAHTSEEIYHGAQNRGLPWGVVRSPEETLQDPHWWDRGFFQKVYHPDLGREITYPGAPYRFSTTPWALRRLAPKLGEHNLEVFHEDLGIPKAQLVALAEAGVI
ncbi:MAG: CoA transferase [Chloroflexi bacterium]|nr:CoA transferase [Chloroflexota bacterium]